MGKRGGAGAPELGISGVYLNFCLSPRGWGEALQTSSIRFWADKVQARVQSTPH